MNELVTFITCWKSFKYYIKINKECTHRHIPHTQSLSLYRSMENALYWILLIAPSIKITQLKYFEFIFSTRSVFDPMFMIVFSKRDNSFLWFYFIAVILLYVKYDLSYFYLLFFLKILKILNAFYIGMSVAR